MGLYGPGGHYLPHYDAFDKVGQVVGWLVTLLFVISLRL